MLVLDSHEFIDMYRGDKDLRLGFELAARYGDRVVFLVPSSGSPSDSKLQVTANQPSAGELAATHTGVRIKSVRAVSLDFGKGSLEIGRSFRLSFGLLPAVIRERPEVIVESAFTTLTPRMYETELAALLRGIPVVYIDAADITTKGPIRTAVARVERRFVRRAAHVITYSQAGKLRYVNEYGYPENRISVIPKPVDTAEFSPVGDSDILSFQLELTGKFVVGFFGRTTRSKGYRSVLDVVRLLGDEQHSPETTFLIVGPKPTDPNSNLSEGTRNHGLIKRVIHTGMLPRNLMPQAYRACDVVVIPDATNPPAFTTVVSESMASGRAILIGNKGWETATPITNGVNGIVVAANSAKEIANEILRLKRDPELAVRLGKNARTFAEQRMDWSVIVPEYRRILIKAITEGRYRNKPSRSSN